MSSHVFHHLQHVPSNYFPALHQKHQEVSNFLHFSKMPLQSTCFQIQFYLCAVLSSVQSRTPLSISRHFAIGRKFLLKASFYTLFSVSQPTLSSIPLSQRTSACFHISPSYCLFAFREKETHFRIQIDLQLNFIQIIRSSLFPLLLPQLFHRRRPSCFFPNTISQHLSQLPLSSSSSIIAARSILLFFTFFQAFLSPSTNFLSFLLSHSHSNSSVLYFSQATPLLLLECVFRFSFLLLLRFESIEYTTLIVHCR